MMTLLAIVIGVVVMALFAGFIILVEDKPDVILFIITGILVLAMAWVVGSIVLSAFGVGAFV